VKGNAILLEGYAKSVADHVLRCAQVASTRHLPGSSAAVKCIEKLWLSLLDHVVDDHHNCTHAIVEDRQCWLTKESEPYKELVAIVTQKSVLKVGFNVEKVSNN